MPPRTQGSTPAPQAAPSTDALLALAGRVGEAVGAMGELTKRLDDIAEGQRDNAAAVEQLAQDTADFRQETAQQLGSISGRLSEGDRRMNELKAEITAMKGQKPEDRPPPFGGMLAEAVNWVRSNWGWLVAVGGTIWGAYVAAKGGTKKP